MDCTGIAGFPDNEERNSDLYTNLLTTIKSEHPTSTTGTTINMGNFTNETRIPIKLNPSTSPPRNHESQEQLPTIPSEPQQQNNENNTPELFGEITEEDCNTI